MAKERRKIKSSAVKKSCTEGESVTKCYEDFLIGCSDINYELLDDVFGASRRAHRKSPIYTFTINADEYGLAAVDVRNFSEIVLSSSLSPEICVFLGDVNSTAPEEPQQKSPIRRCKKNINISSRQTDQQFKEMKVLLHPADVTALSYVNGNMFLSCSLDGTVKVWDKNYQLVETFSDTMKSPSDIHASSKLDYFATSSLSGMRCSKGEVFYGASIFSFSRKKPVRSLIGHNSPTQCIQFHANGLYFATASSDGAVKMWSTQGSERPVRMFHNGAQEQYRIAIAFSPDGKYLASTNNGFVKIWDIASGRLLQTLDSDGLSYNVCFNDSGSQLATGSMSGQFNIWNVNDADLLKSYAPPLLETYCMKRPILRIGSTDNVYTCLC